MPVEGGRGAAKRPLAVDGEVFVCFRRVDEMTEPDALNHVAIQWLDGGMDLANDEGSRRMVDRLGCFVLPPIRVHVSAEDL